MTTHMTSSTSALRVLDEIQHHAPGTLVKIKDLVAATGLTWSQTTRGIAFLRDALAASESICWISERGPYGGVGLTGDYKEARVYVRKRVSEMHTMLSRVMTGTAQQMVASASIDPLTKMDAEMISVSLGRLIEDLERMNAKLSV